MNEPGIEVPSAVERFLEVLSDIFGRKITLADFSHLQDSELLTLTSEKRGEFDALMNAMIITPELIFSPEFTEHLD